jgi:ATP-binding cassette subfamily B protein
MNKDKGDNKKVKINVGPGSGGGPMGSRGVKKPKDFKKSLKSLVRYIKPYWRSIIFVAIFAILGTVFSIVSPKILGNVTNQIVDDYIKIKAYDEVVIQMPEGSTLPDGFTAESFLQSIPEERKKSIPNNILNTLKDLDFSKRPQIDYGSIGKTILLLIALYLLSLLFSYLQSLILTNITQKITYKLRKEISKKIHKLPLKYFDKRSFGDVMSRITNDVDTISQSLNQILSQVLVGITTLLGIVIMMFTISWEMTLIALLILPLSMFVTIFVVKKSQKYFVQQQKLLGTLNGHMEETFTGHNIVRAFNREEAETAELRRENKKLYESGWKSQFLSGLIHPIINLFGNIGYVGIAVLGGWLAIRSRVNIGDIQAFLQYMRQFNQPLMQTANIANVFQSMAASSERVFEFLEEDEELSDSPKSKDVKKIRGDVVFEDVVFSYNGKKNVIENFSANIKAGQRVAIVGPTGAGKTTMVNLLMRFYDVKSGKILIDGIDIRDIKRSSLRKLFGMVLQDTWLFNGTIRENLKYGNSKATDEQMYEATEATYVDHVIKSLPNGYDMIIDEDADNISQGEKQLLTIARAMLVNPPILILDEATSSVDTRTELLIQKAMDKLMEGRTTFVIAHRLSTIKDADLILVMDEGSIIESGNHKQLLEKDGFYAQLYNSQFEDSKRG